MTGSVNVIILFRAPVIVTATVTNLKGQQQLNVDATHMLIIKEAHPLSARVLHQCEISIEQYDPVKMGKPNKFSVKML